MPHSECCYDVVSIISIRSLDLILLDQLQLSWYQSICFLNPFKFLIVSICCQSHPQTIWKIYKKWKISELYFSKTSPISIICLFSIIFNLCNRKHQCWFPTVFNLSNPKEPENNEALYPISFLCPNGTIFNQEVFVCEWWWVVAAPNYVGPTLLFVVFLLLWKWNDWHHESESEET